MKIPQILVNPPDWLAVLISAALGLLWLVAMIVGKNLVDLIR
jgi:hypothetical protein